MIDLECVRVAGQGGNGPALHAYRLAFKNAGKSRRVRSRYTSAPLSSAAYVYEPRKGYGGSRDSRSGDASKTGAHQDDIFSRLDRLRLDASKNSVKEQLERLQAIAALMQVREQGPMPGEMLRVYAWELEDIVKILRKRLKSEE